MTVTRKIYWACGLALLALCLANPVASAEGHGQRHRGMKHGKDAGHRMVMRHLYPVELVRRKGAEIGLSDAQRQKLKKLVLSRKSEIQSLEWDVSERAQSMERLLESGAARQKVMDTLDGLLKVERKIKRKHMALLLSVRDLLTADQRNKLDALKKERRKHRKARRQGARPGPGGR